MDKPHFLSFLKLLISISLHYWHITGFNRTKHKMESVKSFKIFILDDDAFCREMYHQHLKNLGFTEIKSFDDKHDCIDQLKEQPDIIFLDNLTEPSNGIEVLKTIKRFNRDIHVIMMSALEDILLAVSALQYGALSYIIKGENDIEMITSIIRKIENPKRGFEKPKQKKINNLLLYLNLF